VNESRAAQRRLSLVDCASILVGIIIGSGIYESAGLVAAQISSPAQLAGVWIAGAVFALLGALCYAELATRFPEDGGDYVYLTQALGKPIGFLFAWTQLWVIRPGSIGALACVFATYATQLRPLGEHSFLLYAGGSIAVLSLVNMLGVRQGAITQNILSAAKIVGLAALILGGLFGDTGAAIDEAPATGGSWSLAMIFVLFAYSGWNEMGCVAAEVRDPERNILRSLLLGTTIVALAYLGINAACYKVLGLAGMAASPAVAAETAFHVAGRFGSRGLSTLICISALGSTNGMIFTGARIYYAMGRRHRLFALLAQWSPRFGTPLVSLALQAVVTLALVVGFGWSSGDDLPRQAFSRLVMFMTPPFYIFLAASAAAVVVLRWKRSGNDAGFRVPLFPLPPLVIAVAALFMTYSGIDYIRFNYLQQGTRLLWPAAWVVGTFVTGVALALVDRNEEPT
jgi:APA family basic amino acid/polyamine antiporter